MRISDWSSYVFSSDLFPGITLVDQGDIFDELAIALAAKQQIMGQKPTRRIKLRLVEGRQLLGIRRQQFGRAHAAEGGQRIGPVIVRQADHDAAVAIEKIGRASCRERVCQYV